MEIGAVTLVNGTKYDWIKSAQDSYQMEQWSFPDTIPAGKSETIVVDWGQNNSSKDWGLSTYTLENTGWKFQVHANALQGYALKVELISIETQGNPRGSVIDLGWKNHENVCFILSGSPGSFTSTNLPTSWMQNNLNFLKNSNLRQICIPGSHDAGMSIRGYSTPFAFDCNVLTQSKSIGKQLELGIRFFDIRPVIHHGDYFTGHYSEGLGANGQSISDIIDEINDYTENNKELIILYLSHDYDTKDYTHFNQKKWNALFDLLKGIKYRYIDLTPSIDLTRITLNKFIGNKTACVLIVVDPSISKIKVGSYIKEGFYLNKNFPLYDHYAKSNEVNKMISDQFFKMHENKKGRNSDCFLLSWTLTPSNVQAATCVTKLSSSIKYLAQEANPSIYKRLLPECNSYCFPNVIYMDYIDTSNIAALAMAVNQKVIPAPIVPAISLLLS